MSLSLVSEARTTRREARIERGAAERVAALTWARVPGAGRAGALQREEVEATFCIVEDGGRGGALA